MQRLAYVELNHFRSFRKPSRIEFPEKGLMRFRGRNLDTGGESGAGKSTIAHAINFALGACPYPSTALQSWGTNTAASATLGFRDSTYVERGKKFGVVDSAGESVKGSAAQKEDWLSRFFGGLDMDMIMALTYRGQKKPGLFLSKTDSEKKEFLTKLLGLDKFEKAIEDCKVNIGLYEGKVRDAIASYDTVMKTLADLGSISDVELLKQQEASCQGDVDFKVKHVAELKAEQQRVRTEGGQLAQAARESFAAKIVEAQVRIRELQAAPIEVADIDTSELTKQQGIAAQCKQRIARLVSDDLTRRAEMDKQREVLAARVRGLEGEVAASVGLQRDKTRLAMEYETLKNDVCPTCKRDWDEAVARRTEIEDAVVAINAKLEEVEGYKQKAVELRAELDALPRFEPSAMIARLQGAQSEARARAAAEQQKVDSASNALAVERRRQLAEARADEAVLRGNAQSAATNAAAMSMLDIERLGREIAEEQEKIQDVNWKISELRQEIVRNTTLRSQRDRLQEQADEAKAKRDLAETTLKTEKDFMALVGREGFLGSIFDEVLAEISDETNQLLASVANTRQCTLRFASETTTQKGTVKKEIRPVVTIHGYEAPLESGPSGGMYSVIELAVDLAVGAVISRRSGVCPGWLILDESFDGLGAVEKESAMEILQRYAQDRLVIVIDHTTEFQGMFTQSVTVEYKGGDSWVAP